MTPQPPHPLSALPLALGLVLMTGLSASALAASPAQPGKVFKDCKDCPEMVVLPAGTFTMGTPDDELGRQPDEGPLHEVTFKKAFAVSRFQVQNGEWKAYLRSSGYQVPNGDTRDTRPGRECIAGKPRYPQGDKQPAVCLNFHEAEAYAAWLSKKTGHVYKVQSEAQREYAVRGGSSGPFPFPFDEGEEYSIAKHANTYGPKDGFSYTSPAGSTTEIYTLSLHDALPIFSRSGNRNERSSTLRGDWLGFRVVREL